jgi:hypothetical protein
MKTITTAVAVGVLLVGITCQDPSSSGPDPDTRTTDEKPFGVFRILIDQEAGNTTFSGAINDGVTPEDPYESVMKSGELELFARLHPFCESCGSKGKCVAEDSCAPYPTKKSAGTVTIKGVDLADGSSSFTASTIGALKIYNAAVSWASPPFSPNNTITLTAEGSDEVATFQLEASGVERIVVLKDSVVLNDTDPINLSWEPPSVSGTTIMNVEVDISYHGTTKAKIVGDCVDDGSLVIPAEMLQALKSYGISGFPKITMTRRSASGVSAGSRVQLVVEAVRVLYITIPGLISCNPGNPDCPDGMTCTDDRRCE